MRLLFVEFVAAGFALAAVAACSGETGGSSGNGNDGGSRAVACTTVAAPEKAVLPHVAATGEKAIAIIKAIDAIVASQKTPLKTGAGSYAISSLDCSDLEVATPGAADGYSCELTFDIGGAKPVTVTEAAPSQSAQNLFEALVASGVQSCTDVAHGNFLKLEHVSVSANEVELDDASSYATPSAPNVVVQGLDAEDVIAAIAGAGIDDCSAARKVFLVCNSFEGVGGAPTCGYEWMPLTKVGSSELSYACGPSSGAPSSGGTLGAGPSSAIWKSILAAAKSARFVPTEGTLAETTVVNASYFTWDGKSLGFTLVTGNATPPSPSGTPQTP
jgi:hypothetical protein